MNRQNDSGFTLVEVLVAMLVMGILIALTAPRWGSFFTNQQLEEAARQLAADIRHLQSEAIAACAPGWITFYRYGESYKITFPDGSEELVNLPAEVDLHSTTFTVVSGFERLTFAATGAPDAGSVCLSLKKSPTERLFVIVAVATGRVRVSPDPPL